MLFSLRSKLVASFVAVSVCSIVAVSGLAYWKLMERFTDQRLQIAAQDFRSDVEAYFDTYGSWEAGRPYGGLKAFIDKRKAPPADPQGAAISGPSAPPPPPFRFYLFDTQGLALSGVPPYRRGQPVQPEHQQVWQPITYHGTVVAYMVPSAKPNLTEQDRANVEGLRWAIVQGGGVALLLTLGLGWWLGHRLSRNLHALTLAAGRMEQGQWKQTVDVKSRDEVGALAQSFNSMSATLARQYEELNQSHQRIEAMANELRELSMRDALTRLHNRRYFDEQGRQLWQQANRYQRPMAVVLADVDHFKQINDSYSHAVGDEVLRRIGEVFNTQLRATDLVARYGGEEFVIAFPETALTQAELVCELLRQRIESYDWEQVHPGLHVTMSFGLCSAQQQKDFEAALHEADSLLYRAKNEGRNRVCVPS
nr:diguanylate cyclase [Curvibacter sp. CHRR-16]